MKNFHYLFLIIFVIFGFLIYNLFNLQVKNYDKYKQLAVNNFLRKKIIKPARGEILDRNYYPLAENIPSINLYLEPGKIKDKEKLISFICEKFKIPKKKIADLIYENRFRTYQDILVKADIDFTKATTTSEFLNYYPSLKFKSSSQRNYSISNHFTGYIDDINQEEYEKLKTSGYRSNDMIGKSGLEKKYESFLKGKLGHKIEKKNALGKKIEFSTDNLYVPPVNGNDLVLTLDLKYQKYLYEQFKEDEKGSIVVMDSKTGGILAYVSYPSYDPNDFVGKISQSVWDELRNNPAKPMLDRISKATYPPGSVFKPLISSLGLENDIVSATDKLAFCKGYFEVGNRKVKCWNPHGHGKTNLYYSMAYSCDVYFYDLSLRMSLYDIRRYIERSHVAEKTDIDLVYERKGFFPSETWYRKNYGKHISIKGLKVNLSIGQGEILLSPLQVCNYYNALANKGEFKTPHFLQKMIGDETIYYEDLNKKNEKKLPLSEKNYQIIRKSLHKVIYSRYGTGRNCQIPGITIYGKTGSAENHMGDITHAWFACFAEWEEPEITVVAFKENGGHGGSAALPLAKKAIDYYNKFMRE